MSIAEKSECDTQDKERHYLKPFPKHPSFSEPHVVEVSGIPLDRGVKVVDKPPAISSFGDALGRGWLYPEVPEVGIMNFEPGSQMTHAYPLASRYRQRAFANHSDEWTIFSGVDLAGVLSTLNSLAFSVDEDDFGKVRPAYGAFRQSLQFLLDLAKDGRLIRPSDITTDRDAGVRVSWMRGDRETELVCPSVEGELPYIYFSSENQYGTEVSPTSDSLFRKIIWAIRG